MVIGVNIEGIYGPRLLVSMRLCVDYLEGVEVTCKYATYPKEDIYGPRLLLSMRLWGTKP